MRRAGTVVVVVLLGCGSSAGPASFDASIEASCADLQERYNEIVLALDDSCDTPADCFLVGGVSSCDCEAYLGPSCWGHPTNRVALAEASALLAPIESDFDARCRDVAPFDLEGVCDCEPWANATCEDSRCGYDVGEWCLGPICDPDGQTGCGLDQKCTWIWADSANSVGSIDCVADGSVPAGGECAYGPDGWDTGFDDCAAGTICVHAVCRTICGGPDDCVSPETCVEDFADTGEVGACIP